MLFGIYFKTALRKTTQMGAMFNKCFFIKVSGCTARKLHLF